MFTIWSDEVKNRKYILYPVTERRPGFIDEDVDTRNGAEEMLRVARYVSENPEIEALGVLSVAKDVNAKPRIRATYDDDTLFRLKVTEGRGIYTAELVSRPSVRSVMNSSSAA